MSQQSLRKHQTNTMKKGKGKYITDRLRWSELQRLIEELQKSDARDQYWSNVITLGVFFNLRITDLLNLKWEQVRPEGKIADRFKIIEKKTKKERTISISPQCKEVLEQIAKTDNGTGIKKYVISPHWNRTGSITWFNGHLKRVFFEHDVDYAGHVSSHLLRKSFGYRYAELRDFSSEALVYLMALYGHSNMRVTMIYLGLEKRELEVAYHDVQRL